MRYVLSHCWLCALGEYQVGRGQALVGSGEAPVKGKEEGEESKDRLGQGH